MFAALVLVSLSFFLVAQFIGVSALWFAVGGAQWMCETLGVLLQQDELYV